MKFHLERFVQRSTRLGECIYCANLKTMKSIRNKPHKTINKAVKEMNITEKTIESACDCGPTTKDLLKYDVAPLALLFIDDGLMTKPTNLRAGYLFLT